MRELLRFELLQRRGGVQRERRRFPSLKRRRDSGFFICHSPTYWMQLDDDGGGHRHSRLTHLPVSFDDNLKTRKGSPIVSTNFPTSQNAISGRLKNNLKKKKKTSGKFQICFSIIFVTTGGKIIKYLSFHCRGRFISSLNFCQRKIKTKNKIKGENC